MGVMVILALPTSHDHIRSPAQQWQQHQQQYRSKGPVTVEDSSVYCGGVKGTQRFRRQTWVLMLQLQQINWKTLKALNFDFIFCKIRNTQLIKR